ncbi:MFS transporter [Tenggerimyces flavus]|uniref:MFS transporter n=1 Tax=Tenggerimyces flavus TaxID=1708749 RepID=A0ABV7YLG5_9ACTN|nr:MFS transporter [Tenggerimyces flavus]MBM7790235.1 MFS family permease [Tenggerimyces flavus]
MIGTTIEWYDFFLYGAAAALVFNTLFFPNADPLTGTLLAFTTYAIGFAARPIGGLVFGHFGDKVGRKKLLVISLVLMGILWFPPNRGGFSMRLPGWGPWCSRS